MSDTPEFDCDAAARLAEDWTVDSGDLRNCIEAAVDEIRGLRESYKILVELKRAVSSLLSEGDVRDKLAHYVVFNILSDALDQSDQKNS